MCNLWRKYRIEKLCRVGLSESQGGAGKEQGFSSNQNNEKMQHHHEGDLTVILTAKII